jgi:hypothetical protein
MARISKTKVNNNTENVKAKRKRRTKKEMGESLVSDKDIEERKEKVMNQLNEIVNDTILSDEMYVLYNLNEYMKKNLGEYDNILKVDSKYWSKCILKKWKRHHPEFEIDEKLLIIGDADALHHVKR